MLPSNLLHINNIVIDHRKNSIIRLLIFLLYKHTLAACQCNLSSNAVNYDSAYFLTNINIHMHTNFFILLSKIQNMNLNKINQNNYD